MIAERHGGVTPAHDRVASAIAPYGDHAACAVAEDLDAAVLDVPHTAAGAPTPPA